MWRYREAIPLGDDENIISFDEGFTPLIGVDFNGREVLIKQDHLFPTGSYKDRGASVLISKVRELNRGKVVEDSSGNAGCAIAGYCTKADIDCEIFVPEDTSPGKLAQIQLYRAKLNTIPGSREDTAHAVLKAAENAGAEYVQLIRKGAGRLLRSPTLWEDAAKTLFTTNCTWALTRKMCEAVCSRAFIEPAPSGRYPFP